MKTQIESSRYKFAHGKAPKGRGGWAFHPNFNVDSLSPEIFWFNGLYAEAKKAAQAHFAAKGVTVVQVLS